MLCIFLYSDGIVVISNEMFFCLCSDSSCHQSNPFFSYREVTGPYNIGIIINDVRASKTLTPPITRKKRRVLPAVRIPFLTHTKV